MINKAICIIGPTCVGKTDLSIKLLDYFPFEIISVDSCMIYKYMNIGSGKPNSYVLKKYKHNLIDICEPEDIYSVFQFCKDSYFLMKSCWKRNKIPLFVGGSMMYFWGLFYFFRHLSCFSTDLKKSSLCLQRDFINFLNVAVIPVDKNDLSP